MAYEAKGSWSDAYLNGLLKNEGIRGRDAALAARLCYGVMQNDAACRWLAERYLRGRKGFDGLQPEVRAILKAGAYQLAFMDRIPPRAAVDEAVELAKKLANRGAASLVNAVLRRLSGVSGGPPPLPEDDWSVRYSHPKEFIEYFIKRIGKENTRRLLEADNSIPEITARVNTLKPPGIIPNSKPHPWLEGFVVLEGAGEITESEAYKNGLITVQDAAAALPVLAALPHAGMSVLDACAAPGGKAFLAAQLMNDIGHILAGDIYESKVRQLREGAGRLGIGIIEAKAIDATVFDEKYRESFDIVLADVPCSGFGVIRKKPEIRYKSFESIAGLPELQYNILANLSRYVKPGGALVYSTCTLVREENEGVTDRFLAGHVDFCMEGFSLPEPVGSVPEGRTTIWPYDYSTDGFYICRMRKST